MPRNSSGHGTWKKTRQRAKTQYHGRISCKHDPLNSTIASRLLADSWRAEARISRGSTDLLFADDLSFARRLRVAHCVCLWDRDIDATSCESSDFRDSAGVEGEVDRYADVGVHLGERGWALLPNGIIELRNYLFTIDRKRPLNIKYSRAGTAPKRRRQMKVKVRAKIGFMEDGESMEGSGEESWVCTRLGGKEISRPGEYYERNGSTVYNEERGEVRLLNYVYF